MFRPFNAILKWPAEEFNRVSNSEERLKHDLWLTVSKNKLEFGSWLDK